MGGCCPTHAGTGASWHVGGVSQPGFWKGCRWVHSLSWPVPPSGRSTRLHVWWVQLGHPGTGSNALGKPGVPSRLLSLHAPSGLVLGGLLGLLQLRKHHCYEMRFNETCARGPEWEVVCSWHMANQPGVGHIHCEHGWAKRVHACGSIIRRPVSAEPGCPKGLWCPVCVPRRLAGAVCADARRTRGSPRSIGGTGSKDPVPPRPGPGVQPLPGVGSALVLSRVTHRGKCPVGSGTR